MVEKLELFKKKLLYRSLYRGTKEMDILLSSFVRFYINKLNKNELVDLDKFLDFEDEVIYNFYQNNVSNIALKKNKVSSLFKKFKI